MFRQKTIPTSIWSADWKTGVPRNAPVFSLPAEMPPQFAARGPEAMKYQGTPWKFAKRSGNGYSDSGLTTSATEHRQVAGLADDAAPAPVPAPASKIPYILIGAAALAALCLLRKK